MGYKVLLGLAAAVALSATNVEAALTTNSWTAAGNGFWQTAGNWSVGVPASTQAVVLVTNAASKTVTINSATPSGNLTISNLIVRGFGASTNTLQITNAPASLLFIHNGLTVGTNAVLRLTNSNLQVDGDSGGVFNIDGAVIIESGSIIANNLSVNTSIGNTSRASLTMKGGAMDSFRIIAGSTAGNAATFTMAGGTNTVATQFDVAFAANSTGTVWVTGGLLDVLGERTDVGVGGTGAMAISNGIFRTTVLTVGASGRGTLTMAGGGNLVSSNFTIGRSVNATGTVWVTGGQMTITNGVSVIASNDVGQLVISNGTVRMREFVVASGPSSRGTFTMAGGTNFCGANSINVVGAGSNSFGALWINNQARLDSATSSIQLGGTAATGQLVISNGTVLVGTLAVGAGTTARGSFTMAGGLVTVSGRLGIGDFGTSSSGTVWVTGGQLNINASEDIGSVGVGQLTMSNGLIVAAKCVVGSSAGARGTLTMAGGTNTIDGSLTVGGLFPATGTVWIVGSAARLVVTNHATAIGSNGVGVVTVSNGTLLARDIFLARNFTGSKGTLTVAGGTVAMTGPLSVGAGGGTGVVWFTGGSLAITSTPHTVGAGIGIAVDGSVVLTNAGSLHVSNETITIGHRGNGSLTVNGGTLSATGPLVLGGFGGSHGTLTMNSGTLILTNFVAVGDSGIGEMFLNSGTGRFRNLAVAGAINSKGALTINAGAHTVSSNLTVAGTMMTTGTVVIAGGSNAVNTKLTIGNSACSSAAQVILNAGNLSVTNNTLTAALVIEGGTLTQNGGTLTVDRLVITNACARFIKTGGTINILINLDYLSNLDADGDGMSNQYEIDNLLALFNPNDAAQDNDGDGLSNLQEFLAGTSPTNSASAFRIVGIQREGINVRVSWTVVSNFFYDVQAALGTNGNYSTNFVTVSPDIFYNGPGESVTNYVHLGGATNNPALYYRVRGAPQN